MSTNERRSADSDAHARSGTRSPAGPAVREQSQTDHGVAGAIPVAAHSDIRSLQRGVDLERDRRLDGLFGRIEMTPISRGDWRKGERQYLGHHIVEIGYDGTVTSEKDVYNVVVEYG